MLPTHIIKKIVWKVCPHIVEIKYFKKPTQLILLFSYFFGLFPSKQKNHEKLKI